MKKGIRGHDVSVKGLCKICKRCREFDIDYLQLVLEKSVDDFEFGKFTEEYATSIKEQLDDMKIAILGSYINPSNSNDDQLRYDIDRFKEKIRYARVLNPIAVGTETGIYKDGMTDSEEAYQRVLSTFNELVPYAEENGVNVGIECVHFFVINTPEKMKRLIDDLNSDNVRVIFDPVNLLNINNYQNQDEIIGKTFDMFADRICVIHAKDFTVEDGTFKTAKQTCGELNYQLIFEKMKEYNLDIPIICEEIDEETAATAFGNMEIMKK